MPQEQRAVPAIKVTDGTVEVVCEGHWKLFTPAEAAREEPSQ